MGTARDPDVRRPHRPHGVCPPRVLLGRSGRLGWVVALLRGESTPRGGTVSRDCLRVGRGVDLARSRASPGMERPRFHRAPPAWWAATGALPRGHRRRVCPGRPMGRTPRGSGRSRRSQSGGRTTSCGDFATGWPVRGRTRGRGIVPVVRFDVGLRWRSSRGGGPRSRPRCGPAPRVW